MVRKVLPDNREGKETPSPISAAARNPGRPTDSLIWCFIKASHFPHSLTAPIGNLAHRKKKQRGGGVAGGCLCQLSC